MLLYINNILILKMTKLTLEEINNAIKLLKTKQKTTKTTKTTKLNNFPADIPVVILKDEIIYNNIKKKKEVDDMINKILKR